MNLLKVAKISLSVAALATFLTFNPADSMAGIPKKCEKFNRALKAAEKAERKAQSADNKAQGKLVSTQNRLASEITRKANRDESCSLRMTNLELSVSREIDREENKRQEYISQIAALTAQQAACQIGALFGGQCTDERALLNTIAKLTQRITLVEQRIKSAISRGKVKKANQAKKCDTQSKADQVKINRQQANVNAAEATAASTANALLAAQAVTAQKSNELEQCLNSPN